jgi:hypothetical protein
LIGKYQADNLSQKQVSDNQRVYYADYRPPATLLMGTLWL